MRFWFLQPPLKGVENGIFSMTDLGGLKKVQPPYFEGARRVADIFLMPIDSYKPLWAAENVQIDRFQISRARSRSWCQKWDFCNFYSFPAIQIGALPNLRVLKSLVTPDSDDGTLGQHKVAFLVPRNHLGPKLRYGCAVFFAH